MMTSAFMAATTSSRYQKWNTDPRVERDLAPYFLWDIDVCAHSPNICETYWTEEDDCLSKDWKPYPLRFMNPEYGRKIGKFINKAAQYVNDDDNEFEAPHGTTVCLMPSRTGTAWFQDHAPLASQIVYIRGRLIFGSDEYWEWLWSQPTLPGRGGKPKANALFEKYGRKDAAPFDSCFMVFGWGLTLEQRVKLDSYGRSEWPQGTVLIEDWHRKYYPEAAQPMWREA